MTIARILTTKGRDVITTQPDRTLAEVAEVLVANKIGAVVVVDDQGRIIGLLSERDIVRVLAEHGTAVFNDAVFVGLVSIGDMIKHQLAECLPPLGAIAIGHAIRDGSDPHSIF